MGRGWRIIKNRLEVVRRNLFKIKSGNGIGRGNERKSGTRCFGRII